MPQKIDLSVSVGEVELPNPIMCASGTGGYGGEFSVYIDLSIPGAMVVKSLAPFPWDGYPYPRVSFAPGGMLNGVGLQGPGIEAWISDYLPGLLESRSRIVASIWGRSVDEFGEAAKMLEPVKDNLTALELNLSCPNLKKDDDFSMFSHSAAATAEVVRATDIGIPRWAKLSPTTPDLMGVALSAAEAGASAVTLINTLPGMRIDAERRAPYLSAITGGFSGPALKPVALKAVYECYAANPGLPIVGVGGIRNGEDVAEFLMAGASAVQIGTALFVNPRALVKILKNFQKWCDKNEVTKVSDLTGIAHK